MTNSSKEMDLLAKVKSSITTKFYSYSISNINQFKTELNNK